MKRIIGLIIFILCGLAGPALTFGLYTQVMQSQAARQVLFWALAIVGGLGLSLWVSDRAPDPMLDRWWKCVLASALLQTCIYVVGNQPLL
jgi:hypothetical protein